MSTTRVVRRSIKCIGLAITLLLMSCSGAHEPTQGTAPPPVRPTITPTTNVPALLGASIDGLRARLGAAQRVPAGFTDPAMTAPAAGQSDSVAAFRTGGLTVLVSYNARTRRVHDLLLLGRQEALLMGRASLQAGARAYLVLPVFQANRPGSLVGLRVVPTE